MTMVNAPQPQQYEFPFRRLPFELQLRTVHCMLRQPSIENQPFVLSTHRDEAWKYFLLANRSIYQDFAPTIYRNVSFAIRRPSWFINEFLYDMNSIILYNLQYLQYDGPEIVPARRPRGGVHGNFAPHPPPPPPNPPALPNHAGLAGLANATLPGPHYAAVPGQILHAPINQMPFPPRQYQPPPPNLLGQSPQDYQAFTRLLFASGSFPSLKQLTISIPVHAAVLANDKQWSTVDEWWACLVGHKGSFLHQMKVTVSQGIAGDQCDVVMRAECDYQGTRMEAWLCNGDIQDGMHITCIRRVNLVVRRG